MIENFFTRCGLYDKDLLQEKYKIMAPSVEASRGVQSFHKHTFIAPRKPFPGERSGRF